MGISQVQLHRLYYILSYIHEFYCRGSHLYHQQVSEQLCKAAAPVKEQEGEDSSSLTEFTLPVRLQQLVSDSGCRNNNILLNHLIDDRYFCMKQSEESLIILHLEVSRVVSSSVMLPVSALTWLPR